MKDENLAKELITVAVVSMIAMSLFVISDMFFKLVTWKYYTIEYFAVAFTVFFSLIVFSLLWAITKKSSTATLIGYIFIFVISVINQVKISFTKEPLYFSDMKFLKQSGDLLKLVKESVSLQYLKEFIIICGSFFILLMIIYFVSSKYKVELKNKKTRLVIAVIDIILLIILFVPTNKTKELYLKCIFNNDEHVDFDSYVTNLEFYHRNGLLNGMYGVFLNDKFTEPVNYDENMLSNILQETNTNIEAKIEEKPNIILVFSESFWDIDKLKEVEFNRQITSNFNKLKNEGELVNLITPSYGGMSENVSFEMLTGGSMNYFPKGYIPIMSLYSRKNAIQIPSLVKVLNSNGYQSEIIFGKDYYEAKETYEKIGFTCYTELVEKGEVRIPDKICMDFLIQRLEEKKSDEPLFCMMSTIESHMPYSVDKYDKYDVEITKSNLGEEEKQTLKTYAQGMYNADQQLERLYEFVKNYEEPIVLIFLGDHLPYLHTKSTENIVSELEYFNTQDELLNKYRLYNTQALILSNLEQELEIPEYLGTDMLLNCVINQFDIKTEPYYKWLYEISEILPGINKNIAFDKNGKLYNPKEITEEMQENYDIRKLMQYKFFIDN